MAVARPPAIPCDMNSPRYFFQCPDYCGLLGIENLKDMLSNSIVAKVGSVAAIEGLKYSKIARSRSFSALAEGLIRIDYPINKQPLKVIAIKLANDSVSNGLFSRVWALRPSITAIFFEGCFSFFRITGGRFPDGSVNWWVRPRCFLYLSTHSREVGYLLLFFANTIHTDPSPLGIIFRSSIWKPLAHTHEE